MSNVFLGDRNWFAGATLSGGNWIASAPLSELQLPDIARSARSHDTTTGATVIRWDHGTARTVSLVALVNHNLSTSALVRVSLGTSAGGSQVHQTQWVSAYAVSDSDRNGVEHMVVVPIPGSLAARYAMLEIDDQANPDGYIEAGYCWAGEGFSPAFNASYGLRDGSTDLSDSVRTYAGYRQTNKRRRVRSVSFALDRLAPSEAARMSEIHRRLGRSEPILYAPSLGDTEACQRFGMLGALSELAPLIYPSYQTRSVVCSIEEL